MSVMVRVLFHSPAVTQPVSRAARAVTWVASHLLSGRLDFFADMVALLPGWAGVRCGIRLDLGQSARTTRLIHRTYPWPMPPSAPTGRRVALVTLGCARNEVDSEELAGRLAADGWTLVEDAGDADVAVVNTCGFVDAAKK